MDLILGGPAYLKINKHGSSCAALDSLPPSPPSSLSSVRVTAGIWLVFGNKQVGPSLCLGLSFIRRHSQATTRDEMFLSNSGELCRKEGGLVVGQTLSNCPPLSSCWYLVRTYGSGLDMKDLGVGVGQRACIHLEGDVMPGERCVHHSECWQPS